MPALIQLVAQLPAQLCPAAVLVVQHFASDSNGQHARRRAWPNTPPCAACCPHDGDPISRPARIYLAPPDRHLLAKDGTNPPPAGDQRPPRKPLPPRRRCPVSLGRRGLWAGAWWALCSPACCYDGTAGLEFIKRCGGITIVQDPTEAEYPSMPETRPCSNVDIDYVVPLRDMMGSLLDEPNYQWDACPTRYVDVPEDLKLEAAIAERVVGNTEAVAQIWAIRCPSPAPTAAAVSGK